MNNIKKEVLNGLLFKLPIRTSEKERFVSDFQKAMFNLDIAWTGNNYIIQTIGLLPGISGFTIRYNSLIYYRDINNIQIKDYYTPVNHNYITSLLGLDNISTQEFVSEVKLTTLDNLCKEDNFLEIGTAYICMTKVRNDDIIILMRTLICPAVSGNDIDSILLKYYIKIGNEVQPNLNKYIDEEINSVSTNLCKIFAQTLRKELQESGILIGYENKIVFKSLTDTQYLKYVIEL